jgi:hypothetical protein
MSYAVPWPDSSVFPAEAQPPGAREIGAGRKGVRPLWLCGKRAASPLLPPGRAGVVTGKRRPFKGVAVFRVGCLIWRRWTEVWELLLDFRP